MVYRGIACFNFNENFFHSLATPSKICGPHSCGCCMALNPALIWREFLFRTPMADTYHIVVVSHAHARNTNHLNSPFAGKTALVSCPIDCKPLY